MRKSIIALLVPAALLVNSQTNAQLKVTKALPKVSVGIKAGLNMQKITGDAFTNELKAGFVGGAFVSVRKNKIGIRAEALIKTAKIDAKVYYVDAVGNLIEIGIVPMKTLSIDIPVLFEYRLFNRLSIQAGPQYTCLASAKLMDTDVKKSFHTSDIAVAAGLEVNLPLHLTANARYIYGLGDINNASSGAMSNRGIQVTIGYQFL